MRSLAFSETSSNSGAAIRTVTVEVVVARLDHLKDLPVVVAVEGRHPRKQNVQNHAHRPDVAALIVVARQDLGRDVVRLVLLVLVLVSVLVLLVYIVLLVLVSVLVLLLLLVYIVLLLV